MTKKSHKKYYRQRDGKSIISMGLLHVLVCSCLVTLVFSVTFVFPKSSAVQPELTLYKVANRATVTPGDQFNYTIYFENIGPGSQLAQQVWINDTLPSNITYVNDTAYTLYSSTVGYFQYSILSGNTLRIKFTQVPRRNNSFEIRVSVDNTVRNGDVLVNMASMNYTNKDDLLQPEVNATASVGVFSPIMQLDKSVEYNFTDPTRANFVLRVSNIGSAEALYLWVNDTLPPGINYESYQANPAVSCSEVQPQLVSCARNNFVPGVEIWRIMITINPSIPPAARLENYAFLNATDQDGSLLPEIRANATLVVPTAQINADMVAYQSRAQPGSTVQYSIYFNNTGQFNASHVWINDTLPTGVTFLGATRIPILNITGRVGWYLSDVVVGVHVINFDVLIASTLANGTILTNQVSIDYFDSLLRKRPQSTDQATTIVAYNIPSIRVVKISSSSTVEPGGQIIYTIYYNNTGQASASRVTIEDIMPIGTQILAANPLYQSFSGNHYVWNFTNVLVGDHEISITVRVDSDVLINSDLLNQVTMSYTDAAGQHVGSNLWSVIVHVVPKEIPPDDQNYLLWILLIIVVIIIAIALLAYRSYMIKKEERPVIDDVFLLHKDGLLIKHFPRELSPRMDSDILGGMFIAVQNFVNESFAADKGLSVKGRLDELKFGEYSILLARGDYIVVAAVVSGKQTEEVGEDIRGAVRSIEIKFGQVLEKWGGDMAQVAGIDECIRDLMAGKFSKGKKAR